MNENMETHSSEESVVVARNPLFKRTNTYAVADHNDIAFDLKKAADEALQSRDKNDGS
jgi:hypothetical protein